mgnify:CR=1 FL=1
MEPPLRLAVVADYFAQDWNGMHKEYVAQLALKEAQFATYTRPDMIRLVQEKLYESPPSRMHFS